MRNCSEDITNQAAYWECRAALEEKRGDFSEAVECYNKAIQQGAKVQKLIQIEPIIYEYQLH